MLKIYRPSAATQIYKERKHLAFTLADAKSVVARLEFLLGLAAQGAAAIVYLLIFQVISFDLFTTFPTLTRLTLSKLHSPAMHRMQQALTPLPAVPLGAALPDLLIGCRPVPALYRLQPSCRCVVVNLSVDDSTDALNPGAVGHGASVARGTVCSAQSLLPKKRRRNRTRDVL